MRNVERNKKKQAKKQGKKIVDKENLLNGNKDISNLPSIPMEDLESTWENVDGNFLEMISDLEIHSTTMDKMKQLDNVDTVIKEELGGVCITLNNLKDKTEKYRTTVLEKINTKKGIVDVNNEDDFLLYMEVNQGMMDIQEEYTHLIAAAYIDVIPKINDSEEILKNISSLAETKKSMEEK